MTQEAKYAELMRDAVRELEKARHRIAELERGCYEPVAVIGMGCRFPGGADTPEAFWNLLCDGRDSVRTVPADRWDAAALFDADPDAPGRIYSTAGSFLDHVDMFDAEFFGIAPREAEGMDPQQRLLLEVCWEALEHAGIRTDRLADMACGVTIGMMNQDYSRLITSLTSIEAHTGSGNSPSVAAGRIAHVLGLHGPAMTIDTACSSSLAAVHLACQSLRHGECRLALAGGVNAILSPIPFVAECRAHMLSPTGRCHTFDAAADGFVRGEGCGIVVLKRLADALADRDHVWAVIRGSAVNHDGHSSGLTVPNGTAQREVIARALELGGVPPDAVAYIEAHGTGTSLGDPVELRALGAIFGKSHSIKQPLRVGSLKTNFGHMEGAAGIAGLIKAALCVRYGEIPPHLHFETPNPHVPWNELPLKIPTGLEPWPAGQESRIAGVSSFGFSGTNVHVIVEQAPPAAADTRQRRADKGPHMLALSAKSEPALRAMAGQYAARLRRHTGLALGDLCRAALSRRSRFRQRLAILAASAEEMSNRLSDFAKGRQPEGCHTGLAPIIATDSPMRHYPRNDEPATAQDMATLARDFVVGADIEADDAPCVSLPTYPFQRRRHWLAATRASTGDTSEEPPPESASSPDWYEQAWIEAPRPAPDPAAARRRAWLLFANPSDLASELRKRIEDRGDFCLQVMPAENYALRPDGTALIAPDSPDHVARLIADAAAAAETSVTDVIHMWSLDAPPASALTINSLDCAVRQSCLSALHLAQALAVGKAPRDCALWMVTRSAQAARPEDFVDGLAQSPLWGLGKGIAAECPALGGGLIDLDAAPGDPAAEAQRLYEEFAVPDTERLLAFRSGLRYAARVIRVTPPDAQSPDLSPSAAYLITGGLGGLGMETCRWMADHGARHIVLVGRRPPDEPTRLELETLREGGVELVVMQADVAEEQQMLAVFERVRSLRIELRGVVHAAGMPGYAPLAELEAKAVAEIFRAKLAGAWVLHKLTRNTPLDFFICYSSMTSVWGAEKQTHYTAANQFIDALAHYRAAQGLPALTLNWGPIAGRGMFRADYTRALLGMGIRPMQPRHMAAALSRAPAMCKPQLIVADIDWRMFRDVYEARGGRRLFALLEPVTAAAPSRPGAEPAVMVADADTGAIIIQSIALALKTGPASIDVSQPLVDMGLDSLMALDLRNRLFTHTGVQVPVSMLLGGASVTALTQHILAARAQVAHASATEPIADAAPSLEDRQMSYGQRALWFIHCLAPESPAYNLMLALTIAHGTTTARLQQAVSSLAARHESLRTVFIGGPDGPLMRVNPHAGISVAVTDAATWSREALDANLAAEADRPFRLDQGPLTRFSLWRNCPTEPDGTRSDLLVMASHHIVTDFASLDMLVSDLDALYREPDGDAGARPAPPQKSYADYVRWEADLAQGDYGERAWGYWRKQLGGDIPVLDLPTDRPRTASRTYRGAAYATGLEPELCRALKAAAAAEHATPFMLALAAYQALLAYCTGQHDFLVGMHGDNRGRPEFERMAGYCVNQLVIRAALAENPDLRTLLRRVRQSMLEAMEFRHYPFPLLVEKLQPARDPSRSPLFDVDIVWDQARGSEASAGAAHGLVRSLYYSDQRGADFDLMLTIVDMGGPYRIVWRFNTDLYDERTIRTMAGLYTDILKLFITNPEQRLADLRLWTEDEARGILELEERMPIEI